MRVRDLMTPDPVTVQSDDSVDLAERLLGYAHVRHLPVVDDGEVIGLVTHRDLSVAFANLLRDKVGDVQEKKRLTLVDKIMQRDVQCVGPDTDVLEVIHSMLDTKVDCLPVREHNRLVGIITHADILKFAERSLREERARSPVRGAGTSAPAPRARPKTSDR